MRNKYPGTCYVCGKQVMPNEGHFERLSPKEQNIRGVRWRVQCKEHAKKFISNKIKKGVNS